MRDLLIEIGTEELPPKQLNKLCATLSANLQTGLKKAGLSFGQVKTFATPRRLAISIEDLPTAQPSHIVEKRGPALKAAFDAEGHPTLACLGFANACNTSVDQLLTQETEKGAWIFFRQEQPGALTTQLLPNILTQALQQLPIAKPMRWGQHDTTFIRPVHWIVLLLGQEIIDTKILGHKASNQTYGHRFHHPEAMIIPQPKDYERLLKESGFVLADYEARKQAIRKQIEKVTANKGQAVIDEDLLDEVNSLVEWPVALLGEFDAQFLEVPAEAIMTAMQTHQKYFPVVDANQQLLPYFVTVSNIASKDPARVKNGNQRVIRARLADAQFFFHTDLKHRLESRLEALKKVIFQQKLGTLFDKSQRIAHLAEYLAQQLGANTEQAERAGFLAKADLVTAMVGEFPELQGVMGYYYALKDGEKEAVALAVREHYQPRFSGDVLPTSIIGCLVSIADKIDTIVGLFGIKQPPSGEKDPFALRRAALGVLRIFIEKQLPLDLHALLNKAALGYGTLLINPSVVPQTFDFMMERLRAWYLDRGIAAEVFSAVLARTPTSALDFHHRIQAVQHFQSLPEAQALAAAHKRVSNILKDPDGEWRNHPINPTLLTEAAEHHLLAAMEQKNKEVEPLFRKAQYTEVLTHLAALRAPIDEFFNKVMVMVEDERLRNNRLALLYQLQQLFLQVADISQLAQG